MKKVELLAPAGDLEKLIFAIDYGADAVYVGGEFLGLRTSTKNFSLEDLREGLSYAHARDKKVYLALNAIPHNDDIDLLKQYLKDLNGIGIDAFIVSDPGVLSVVKEMMPQAEIHLSTQANNTNYMSANFWHKQGVSRIILARELSIDEIVVMAKNIEEGLELEAFIHGAMCMSYSGRCLLSNYMTGRDANRGACAQPCRWKYKIIEEKRPEEVYDVEQDERGTYLFNSKDLCGMPMIKDLIESGLSSLKIEGRSKSIYYVSEVVRVYREAIDSYYRDAKDFEVDEEWIEELKSVSHREYCSGFLLGKPDSDSHLYGTSAYVRNYDFLGVVESYDKESCTARVQQRNKISVGDEVEIIGPKYFSYSMKIESMTDENGASIDAAPHPKQYVNIPVNVELGKNYIIRKKLK